MKWVDYEWYAVARFGDWLFESVENYFRRRERREHWHAWFAWRPISIPETKHGSIVVKRHYVWLEYVDRKRHNCVWKEFRTNTLAPGHYEHEVYAGNNTYQKTVSRIDA